MLRANGAGLPSSTVRREAFAVARQGCCGFFSTRLTENAKIKLASDDREMWAFKNKAFDLWRPKRHRPSLRASKAKSKQLQPAMTSADGIRTDGVRTSANVKQTIAPRQSTIAALFARLPMAPEYWRKLITVTGRPPPRAYEPPRGYEPPQGKEPQAKKNQEAELKPWPLGRAGAFAISICFGLLVCSGIVIATLFAQLRDMQADIASLKLRLAGVDSHVSRLELTAQQKIIKEAKLAETSPPPPPRRIPISLSNDDIKLIRASIKVLPSQPGAQPKVQLGQEVSVISTVPVPGSVVGQIPKLRGARFLVDDNGAIVIVAEGSNHADVVIEPQ